MLQITSEGNYYYPCGRIRPHIQYVAYAGLSVFDLLKEGNHFIIIIFFINYFFIMFLLRVTSCFWGGGLSLKDGIPIPWFLPFCIKS